MVIVKLLTNEPGLYGLGCATHRERPLAVATALEQYMKPFVMGRNCDEIEDIWQSAYVSSYFRSGVTLNNCLSGIDGALWDILGQATGQPVGRLLGGRYRERVRPYASLLMDTPALLSDRLLAIKAQGFGHYLAHLTGGVHWALWPIMIPIEILGLFTKPFALCIRLFANMTAGHVAILAFLGMIFIFHSYAVALPAVVLALIIMLLEMFVALLQAYIFAMLTTLFIGFSVHPSH